MKTRILFVILFGAIITIVCAYFYTLHRDYKIKSSPQRFVYETYSKAVNQVIFITNLRYKDEYIKYYQRVKAGENPAFNFPLKTFPEDDPVYILEYTSDSSLVKVVSYYDRGRYYGGSYNEGYVIPEAIHIDPPNKSINK